MPFSCSCRLAHDDETRGRRWLLLEARRRFETGAHHEPTGVLRELNGLLHDLHAGCCAVVCVLAVDFGSIGCVSRPLHRLNTVYRWKRTPRRKERAIRLQKCRVAKKLQKGSRRRGKLAIPLQRCRVAERLPKRTRRRKELAIPPQTWRIAAKLQNSQQGNPQVSAFFCLKAFVHCVCVGIPWGLGFHGDLGCCRIDTKDGWRIAAKGLQLCEKALTACTQKDSVHFEVLDILMEGGKEVVVLPGGGKRERCPCGWSAACSLSGCPRLIRLISGILVLLFATDALQ